VRDAASNKLVEGHLVYWVSKGLVCKVLKVKEDELSINRDGLPTLVLEVAVSLIAYAHAKRGSEPQFTDFMRIVDPNQEEALSKILQ